MRFVAAISIGCLFLSQPAWASSSEKCPFSAEYLTEQLGVKLKVSHQASGLLGNACEYRDDKKTVKFSVDAGPNPAPTPEMWLKMANPPGTKWKAVAGDPDKAVVLESYPNGDPFPAVFYQRKGWLVNMNFSDGSKTKSVADWNARLLKLKRLPE